MSLRTAAVSALTLLAATVLTALPAAAASAAPVANPNGEVIVQFKRGAALTRTHALPARASAGKVREVLARRAAAMGTRLGRPLAAGSAVGERTQVLRASGMSATKLAARLAADPEVEFAVPNGRARRLTAPDDPLYPLSATERRSNGLFVQDGPASGQWYLRAPAATLAGGPVSSLDIERAWARSRGSAGVVVAVLDTGVRPEHPDLTGRLLPGYDFVSNCVVANDQPSTVCNPAQGLDPNSRDADPSDPGDWVTAAEARTSTFTDCVAEDSSWHGTKTAALVGASADDGIGMAGAAPGVSVLPVRVLGKGFGTTADIQTAMRWAVGLAVPGVPLNPNPAKVLNLSLGGVDTCDAGYQSAVNDVLATGAVIVAAAGNSAGGPVGAPANCAGVIGVLALRHAGTKVGFSDLGPQIAIAAPGGNCINTSFGSPCLYPLLTATDSGTQGPVASRWTDSYDASVGTSFASPLVAATAGLMFSVQPALTPAMLLARLQATARPFPTTGGDNGDGSVVPVCVAPSTGIQQLQCYCTTALCGAGMLDAGAAVNAVAGPIARIAVTTANPTAGSPVTLSAAGSLVAAGSTINGYQWELSPGSGIVSGFDSASNAATATLTPSAAGSFTVTVAVTDGQGNTALASQTVTVAAAPVATPVTPPLTSPATGGGGGGGGGASSAPWVALLALAAAALFRDARRQRRA